LVEEGIPLEYELEEAKSTDIISFCYTSGSTGMPKCVMLNNLNFLSGLASTKSGNFLTTDVYISYLPLSHVYEQFLCFQILYAGGGIGFYSGDISKIKEDI